MSSLSDLIDQANKTLTAHLEVSSELRELLNAVQEFTRELADLVSEGSDVLEPYQEISDELESARRMESELYAKIEEIVEKLAGLI